MPTISIYIRKEDLPLWRAVHRKSEQMHSWLNNGNTVYTDAPKGVAEALDKAQPVADFLPPPENIVYTPPEAIA